MFIVQAERIGAVLVNVDLNIRHAQAQVIEDMVATGGAEFGRGLVGQLAEFIEVLAAEADLNRFLDRRSLFELFDDATQRREPSYPAPDAI